MRIDTVERYGHGNECYVCGADLSGEYFAVNLFGGAVALLVCSNDCEADVWIAAVDMFDIDI
jgi:hypothetical protein